MKTVALQVQSFEQLLLVSAEIDRHYRALFDLTIENKNIECTVDTIRAAFDRVCSDSDQWIPLNWLQPPLDAAACGPPPKLYPHQ